MTIRDLWPKPAPCLKNPDGWFPPGNSHTRAWKTAAAEAAHICRTRCPIRQQCLREALDAEQGRRAGDRHGIAGGHTPAERAVLDPTLPAPAAA
ncbi:WhiB family transcriptional regulator [Streptomyces sp. 891-h]|uniref:WhiB family transcriptional regulator n=1 Tax=Streptomyces sp. 891-h TaxID=2720714 RepID=UPI001FAB1634|nr:WhiB family transcriptional regulator [Streptomyces sp. 891-h]UNZ20587.1 WhiB family transcriptional regulator [Streptomyces sp. 891-h]